MRLEHKKLHGPQMKFYIHVMDIKTITILLIIILTPF